MEKYDRGRADLFEGPWDPARLLPLLLLQQGAADALPEVGRSQAPGAAGEAGRGGGGCRVAQGGGVWESHSEANVFWEATF